MADPVDEAARRLRRDMPAILKAGADSVVSIDGKPSPAEVRAIVDAQRAAGFEVAGCSFCASHQPTGDAPLACPYCGTVVTREPQVH